MELLPSLTIILPAFNEASNIEQAVSDALSAACRWAKDFEVIVVNDGSEDETGYLADELARRESALRVFHHSENLGMGKAIQTGLREARGEYILFSASDNQVVYTDLGRCVEKASPGGVVLCYRVNPYRHLGRRIVHWGYGFCLRSLFGLDVEDYSWIKLYHRSVLERVDIESSGFFWDAEVLIKAYRSGASIAQVPTVSVQRLAGRSSAFTFRGIFKTAQEMLTVWWRMGRLRAKKSADLADSEERKR